MNRPSKRLIVVGLLSISVVGVLLLATFMYSVGQLRVLRNNMTYASPEEGTQALIAQYYSGVSDVKIIHIGREFFDDLCFVEAHVWAENRNDGKGFSIRDYDNPGWFFLRIQDGWVFVSEGRFPEIIAFGKWLFQL